MKNRKPKLFHKDLKLIKLLPIMATIVGIFTISFLATPTIELQVEKLSSPQPKKAIPTKSDMAASMETKATTQSQGPTISDLVKAIEAIRAPNVWLSTRYKKRVAEAALAAYKSTGVDPYLMIAIARMESDFRRLIKPNKKLCYKGSKFCWADCGITQHHVRGNYDYVMRWCKWLKWNHKLSFLKSSQEIAYLQKWCRIKRPYRPGKWTLWDKNHWRCVLNQYNQGSFYKRAPRCWKIPQTKPLKRKQCFDLSVYWKKVLCFKYGAVHKKKSRYDICRYYKPWWTIAEIKQRAYSN